MLDAGYGNSPTSLKVGFSNFQITEVYYNGKKASSYLNNMSFPVSKKLQADLTGSVIVSKGRTSISYSFKKGWVSDGALDTYDLPSSTRNKIFQVFGEDVTCNDIKINMNSATVSKLGVSFIGSIVDEMKKQSREKKQQKVKDEIKEKKIESNTKKSNTLSEKNVTYNNKKTINTTSKESIYQKRQRESREKEIIKNKREKKRYDEGMAFIENQKKKTKIMEDGFRKLENDLTNTFTQINNDMIKQRAFNSRVSSLTSIRSTSLTSIISESRRKNSEINSLYNKKSTETLNQIVQKGAKLIGGAKNETELAVFGGATILTSALAKKKIEKQKREAKERLEAEKKSKINKLVTKFKSKITPLKDKYKELATYAISNKNQEYYLAQYKYYNCLLEDAYYAMQGDDDCNKPREISIQKNRNPSGEEYYHTYKRKAKSDIGFMNAKAETFLDLAIEAEPKNAIWLYEKTLIKKLGLYENAAILKKAHELDKNNNKINDAYKKSLDAIANYIEAERLAILNTVKSQPNFNWEKHSNLMGIKVNNKFIFANSKGERVFILKEGLSISSNRNNIDEKNFNNGLLKVGIPVKNVKKSKVKNTNNKFLNSFINSSNQNLKYGFINTKQEVIIPFKYNDIGLFSEGLAAVKNSNTQKWGFIDVKENIIIPFKYNKVGKFSEGLAFVKETIKDEKWILGGNLLKDAKYKAYYIDKTNKIIVSEKFDTGEPFKNGSARVTKYATNDSFMGGGSNKTYYINREGQRLNKQDYNLAKASNFKNGYATVKNDNYYAIINEKGEITSKLKFHNKPVFKNGIAIVETTSAFRAVFGSYVKYGYIDYTGKTIAKIKYTKAGEFVDGKALVEENNETFYIDKEGNKINNEDKTNKIKSELKNATSIKDLEDILSKNYEEVLKSGNGYRVKKDARFGFITKRGEIKITVSLKRLGLFHDGLAIFTDKSKGTFVKCGYINEEGEKIVEEKFGECSDFSEGIAVVGKVNLIRRKVGYINTKGKTIIPFKYYTGTSFVNGKAQVNNGSFYKPDVYYINKKGQKVN
ncbi:hypothetical protein PHEL85_1288 [Polaribacter sp. Hel1_85]|nr:hypothetical protein PHEL85_1288 [Polaribacter sp. Hel1_85]